MSNETEIPNLPSTVYLVYVENKWNSLSRPFKRIYLEARFVRQFVNQRYGTKPPKHRIHVYVRDAEMGDIDWREVTQEFVK